MSADPAEFSSTPLGEIVGLSCGCELRRRAADSGMFDDVAYARLKAQDEIDAWRCPGDGSCDEPTEPVTDPMRRQILGDTEKLTGASGLRTCPMWYASLPWVHRAVRANAWREKGQLELVEPDPSYRLIQAVDLVSSAQGRQFREDMKRRENARKRGDDG